MPSSSSKAESLAVLGGREEEEDGPAAWAAEAEWWAWWLVAATDSVLGTSLPANEVGTVPAAAAMGIAAWAAAAREVGLGAGKGRT